MLIAGICAIKPHGNKKTKSSRRIVFFHHVPARKSVFLLLTDGFLCCPAHTLFPRSIRFMTRLLKNLNISTSSQEELSRFSKPMHRKHKVNFNWCSSCPWAPSGAGPCPIGATGPSPALTRDQRPTAIGATRAGYFTVSLQPGPQQAHPADSARRGARANAARGAEIPA